MNGCSDPLIPVLTPPVAFLGKEQRIVIECAADFPCNDVTVDLLNKGGRRGLLNRQTATVLGPRTCRIELPILALESEGDYLLVLRFNSLRDKQFPEIPLRVLSPLEAIHHCIPVSSGCVEKAPVLAAVVAYLIQCARIGRREVPAVGDEMLCQILECMYARKLPIMSVPAFLCDRYYGGHETLLHLALHLHLEQTSSFLLTDDIITNFKGILDLHGYDKKRPLEIARERGMSEISDRIVALTTAVQDHLGEDRTMCEESVNWEKPQQQADEEDGKQDSSSDEGLATRSKLMSLSKTRLGQMCKTTLVGAKQAVNRRYTQLSRAATSASHETSPRNHHSKTAVKEQEETDKSPTEEGSLTRQISVDELKQDCIYKKMIITDYVALDEANSSTQLQIGDIAHVVEEFKMCKGVVNNVYCQFPLAILSPLMEEKRPQHMPARNPVEDDDRGYAAVCHRLPSLEEVFCGQDSSGPAYAALVRDTVLDDDDYMALDVTTMCMSPRQKEYHNS